MVLDSIFKKSKQRKKANVFLDSFFYFVAVIVFIVVVVTGSFILGQINTDIQADDDMSNQSKVVISDLNTNMPTWFDYGCATIILLLWILVLVSSFYIDTHPVFFFVSVIALMSGIFVLNQFMEAIDDYFADPEITPILNMYPISSFIVNNVEIFIAVVGFSIAIALWAKNAKD